MQKSELFWQFFVLMVLAMVISGIGLWVTEPAVITKNETLNRTSSSSDTISYSGVQLLPKGVDANSYPCHLQLVDTQFALFGEPALGTVVQFDCDGNVVYMDESIISASWDVKNTGEWNVESEYTINKLTFEYENPGLLHRGLFFMPCCLSTVLSLVAFFGMIIASRLEDTVVLEP